MRSSEYKSVDPNDSDSTEIRISGQNQINELPKTPVRKPIGIFNFMQLLTVFLAFAFIVYLKLELNSTRAEMNISRIQTQSLMLQVTDLNSQSTMYTDLAESLSTNYTNLKLLYGANTILLNEFQTKLESHETQLIRLSNGTSNADVLDQLYETKTFIDNELDATKAQITDNLDIASRNVTSRINKSQTELDETVKLLKDSVTGATSEIYGVQSNVTHQLAAMQFTLQLTVEQINSAVTAAQTTIQTEVKGVKDDIEQYVAVTNKQFAAENDFVKYQLAGTFTLLGCLISLWHMTSHLRHYNKPNVQRRVMAVLWMVPIYGITSWLSLVFPRMDAGFSAVRDCYEAYAVYTFIALLIAILEDGKGQRELIFMLARHIVEERSAISAYAQNKELGNNGGGEKANALMKAPVEHLKPIFPCCYVHHKPVSVAAAWLYQCQLMAIQFVMLKPILTALPFVITACGIDYETRVMVNNRTGEVHWDSPKLYVGILQNLSVAIAFYALLKFYHGMEQDLAWCDPWPKFLCIKGVVFMTFWQGCVLQGMSSLGLVDERAASQIQNFLICIEMLLASLAHYYIFPYNEWQDGYKAEREQLLKQKKQQNILKETLAIGDFARDVRGMVTRGWYDSSSAHGGLFAPHSGGGGNSGLSGHGGSGSPGLGASPSPSHELMMRKDIYGDNEMDGSFVDVAACEENGDEDGVEGVTSFSAISVAGAGGDLLSTCRNLLSRSNSNSNSSSGRGRGRGGDVALFTRSRYERIHDTDTSSHHHEDNNEDEDVDDEGGTHKAGQSQVSRHLSSASSSDSLLQHQQSHHTTGTGSTMWARNKSFRESVLSQRSFLEYDNSLAHSPVHSDSAQEQEIHHHHPSPNDSNLISGSAHIGHINDSSSNVRRRPLQTNHPVSSTSLPTTTLPPLSSSSTTTPSSSSLLANRVTALSATHETEDTTGACATLPDTHDQSLNHNHHYAPLPLPPPPPSSSSSSSSSSSTLAESIVMVPVPAGGAEDLSQPPSRDSQSSTSSCGGSGGQGQWLMIDDNEAFNNNNNSSHNHMHNNVASDGPHEDVVEVETV